MFSVEVKFKVHDTEVTLQRFAELFLLEGLRSAQQQLQQKRIAPPTPASRILQAENRSLEPKLLSIPAAANVLGLRPPTIRSYVATRQITFVRIGRRVLIPRDAIEEAIRTGLYPAKSKRAQQ